jgi:hypothetical protein
MACEELQDPIREFLKPFDIILALKEGQVKTYENDVVGLWWACSSLKQIRTRFSGLFESSWYHYLGHQDSA